MSKPTDRDNNPAPTITPAPGVPEVSSCHNLPRQRLLSRFYRELNSPEGPSEEMAAWWWAQY